MKKILTALGVLAMVSVVHANVWNINWMVMEGFSPLDLDEDESPTLLANYDVTWSLVYGSNLALGEDGLLNGGTTIASMHANAGDSTISWTDALYDPDHPRTGSYDQTLYPVPGSITTYLGSTTETAAQTVYQYIFISGPSAADNETGLYTWLSEGVSVTPTDDTTAPAVDIGGYMASIAHETSSGAYSDAKWTPAVPEPATMSLLGLGALAMVLRRKVRK